MAAAVSTALPAVADFVAPGRLYPGTSSSANDSAGFPCRNSGRSPLSAPLSDVGTFASEAGFASDGFAPEDGGAAGLSVDAGGGALPDCCESDAGEDPLLSRGGPSLDESLGFGAELDGALPELELGFPPAAGFAAVGSRVSRGGASASSIPTGVLSAFCGVAIGSVPAGRHAPVPIQGACELTLLLCNALPTVNRPSGLPARSPSYTTPESSDIGTGSALYALASQNLPLIRIATGMIDAFPFAPSCRIPSARGPESFFFAGFLSPGMICGRSSCALAASDPAKMPASAIATVAPRYRIQRCRIFEKPQTLDLALDFNLPGEFPMKVNDKAPDFTLQDENGQEVAIGDLRGKTVVLFFYPRANTPG